MPSGRSPGGARSWLAVPAACGVVWVLAIGPAAALAGFLAAPRAVVALLTGVATDPARLAHLGTASTGSVRWFPGQFPIALILAAGLAAVAWWLDWLHTDEWRLPAPRPGLVSLCRRRFTAAFVKSGGVLTRSGACLGVDAGTGRPAAVPWREAERGVLVTGSARPAVAASGFQLVHAAIRLRKPVIVVDLAAGGELAGSLAAVCAATGAPLQVFGAAGTGYYEPFRDGEPARMAALVMGMLDWDRAPDSARLGAQACLTDVFAVAAAAPADPAVAVLDDVAGLLRPGALAARMDRVPAYHPRRPSLAGQVVLTAELLAAEGSMAAFIAEQLAGLRASPLGRWLGPAPATEPGLAISVGEVVRTRGVVLFSLDSGNPRAGRRHGRGPGRPGRHRGLRQAAPGGDRRRRPGLVRPVRDGRSAGAGRPGRHRCRRRARDRAEHHRGGGGGQARGPGWRARPAPAGRSCAGRAACLADRETAGARRAGLRATRPGGRLAGTGGRARQRRLAGAGGAPASAGGAASPWAAPGRPRRPGPPGRRP